jgi:transcriptional regulator with XRE-family HTH domain
MPTFAESLAVARTAAGLSQYALAQKAGISKQSLSTLELGTRQPSLETAMKLAKALGITIDQLAGGGQATPPKAAASAASKRKRGK